LAGKETGRKGGSEDREEGLKLKGGGTRNRETEARRGEKEGKPGE
jgi:hypothetical protein